MRRYNSFPGTGYILEFFFGRPLISNSVSPLIFLLFLFENKIPGENRGGGKKSGKLFPK